MTISKRVWAAMLTACVILYVLRMAGLLPAGVIADHASNVYLTGVAFLLICYRLLVTRGFTRRSLALALLPFALLNVVVELVLDSSLFEGAGLEIGAFNTADPLDMVAGLLGLVLIAAVVLISARETAARTASDRERGGQREHG